MKDALRYYTSEIHAAAFVLPKFADAKLASVRPAPGAVDWKTFMLGAAVGTGFAAVALALASVINKRR